MGAVFRATDSRLERPVAVKILSPAKGVTPEAAQRLFREARAASALNYPNVVTIFDVGVDRDASYIVMELVEGNTLAEILGAGRLSTSRLVKLAVQIADGLASAHAKGIVHRDLKPGNIMVTPNEQIKLLDFGLAKMKLLEETPGSAGTNHPDAFSSRPGIVAGTRGYMSPEQARGEPADFRSDQFSFGAVLYEMATGCRAFAGTGGAAGVGASAPVAHDAREPVTRLDPEIPLPLQWAIERCLAKEPPHRYPSTRELCADLAGIAERLGQRPADAAAPNNLPAPRTALIGRDHELTTAMQLIVKAGARLVTLTGAGGIGKTRLLIALGRELLDEFSGGVFFVPLDRISNPELVASSIAAVLGIHETAEKPTASVLQAWLRRDVCAPTLLLIDNFEHVLAAATLVAELLSASDQLTIAVTSRAALRVYGEYELSVPPLQVPDRGASDAALAESAAVRLFLDRAPAVRLQGPRGPDELRLVAEICACLDGLPLAIELAAARSKVLSLPVLLERLGDPLQLLSGGPRDLPARQRTLRATIEWSYRLLNETQQKLFRRFGVFIGGATLEAIEAVCNVDEDLGVDLGEAVESLVDSSLLRPMDIDSAEPRFAMLETMREYALARLAEAGEEAHTRRAHAAYCRVLADESSYVAVESEREALYDRYEQELGNLRAALDWLVASGDADWGLRLAYGLGPYWHERGRAAEGYERLIQLLAVDGASEELRAWASASAGDLAKHCGYRQAARQHTGECLAIGRRLHDVPLVLRGLNALSVMTQHDGELEQSRAHHEEALAVARAAGAPPGMLAGLMSNYADLVLVNGEYELAQQLQQEILRLCNQAGDESALAWCLNHQGDIARARGDFERAGRLYDEALARFRGLGERLGIAGCLHDLARVLTGIGDHATAEARLIEALSLYRELDHRADVPRVLDALAECALAGGDAGRTITLSGSAAGLRRTLHLDVTAAVQAQLDRTLDAARARLPTAEATACWMAGWRLSPDEVTAFALRGRDVASSS